MKKGLIVIFDKDDLTVLKNLSVKLSFNRQIKICLINNGNDNKILNLLTKIKNKSKCDVFILNLRKEKPLMLAVKAGVRFLYNINDLDLIFYTKSKDTLSKIIVEKLGKLTDIDLITKKEERVLLRNVFSLDELNNC
ncbi:MAG: hypothetical protein P8O89_02575 [Polaribacter sp.]|nr:hypothetical protein [Polaribacter sp.]